MRLSWATITAGVVLLSGCNPPVPRAHGNPSAPDFYRTDVQPIFRNNCYRCHGAMNHRGGLNLDTPGGLLKGGKHGRALVPGDPAKSLLIRLIRHEGPADHPMPMPPRRKLPEEDIHDIEQWVRAGAMMPPDPPKP